MSAGVVFLHLALVVVTFLVMLNGYLRGAAKAKTDGALSVAWVGLLILATFVFGWRQGLIALVLSFLYSRAWVPIASAVSHRLLGYRTTLQSDEAPVNVSVESLLKSNEADNQRLRKVAAGRHIARVLQSRGLGPEDLKEQFWFLMSSGLGDLSWEIVSDSEELTQLLDMRDRGSKPIEIAAHFMDLR